MDEEDVTFNKVRLATLTLSKLTGDDDEDYPHKQLVVTLLSSAASEHAEESRWKEAASLVKMFLPHVDVVKRPKRKQLYNFCAVVLLYAGDSECVNCQDQSLRLYIRDMEYKKAAREAENFASVLLEKGDYANALRFYLRAAEILERDER